MGGQCSCPIVTESPSSSGGTRLTFTPLESPAFTSVLDCPKTNSCLTCPTCPTYTPCPAVTCSTCPTYTPCPTLKPVDTLSLTTPIYPGFYLMGVNQPYVAIDYNYFYTSNTTWTGTRSFGITFTKPPVVILTSDFTSSVVCTLTSVSTTAFKYRVSSIGTLLTLRYLAIGTLATLTSTPVSYGTITSNLFYLPAVLNNYLIFDIGKLSVNENTPYVTFFGQNPFQTTGTSTSTSTSTIFSGNPIVFTNVEDTNGCNTLSTLTIGTTYWAFKMRYNRQVNLQYFALGTTSLTNQIPSSSCLFGSGSLLQSTLASPSINMVIDFGSALVNDLSGSINFNFTFAQPPIVLLTAVNDNDTPRLDLVVSLQSGSVKMSGFQYIISAKNGNSVTIMYIAVGPIA